MSVQIPTKQVQLSELRVSDTMHPGVLTCPVESPLRDVARILASYNVHCVIVLASAEGGDERPWGVISDLDLVGAALTGDADEHTAGEAAASPVVFVSSRDTLEHAAQLMSEHQTAHLVVIDPETFYPVGILSTLDVAAALADLPVRSGPPRIDRR